MNSRRSFLKFASVAIPFGILPFQINGQREKRDLDLINLKPSELVVVAARPSVGKTNFMLRLADRFYFDRDECSMFFSIEMSREQLISRWQQLSSVGLAAPWFAGKDVLFDDTSFLTTDVLREKINGNIQGVPRLRYVFVDYLQLMNSKDKSKSRGEQVHEILRTLKEIATELNLSVVVSSQLNRPMIGSREALPAPRNIREVSDFSNIDRIVLLHRENGRLIAREAKV